MTFDGLDGGVKIKSTKIKYGRRRFQSNLTRSVPNRTYRFFISPPMGTYNKIEIIHVRGVHNRKIPTHPKSMTSLSFIFKSITRPLAIVLKKVDLEIPAALSRVRSQYRPLPFSRIAQSFVHVV